jgi:hypothetical protein
MLGVPTKAQHLPHIQAILGFLLMFLFIKMFFYKYSINTDIHTCISTHSYEYTHVHPNLISTSKRLNRFNVEIHKINQQERLIVDEDITSHLKNN